MKSIQHLFLMLLPLLLVSCNDDQGYADVDGLSPMILLETPTIRTEPGREFVIQAAIEDADGLRSVRLQNTQLDLDKTIDILTTYDELQQHYSLNYKFKTDADFTGDNLDLIITATDIGGRTTTSNIRITMDGDFMPPVFTAVPDGEITVLMKEVTTLNLRFTVEDDKQLDYVSISIPELNYSKTITASGRLVTFSETINLPSTVATYNLVLEAVDKFSLSTIRNSVITVSEMPDFSKMYLVDVDDAAKLNSDIFGIPMLIERTAPYTYKARYYAESANTKVRFIPQKTDFYPICFGISPDNTTILTDVPDISLPIVLPGKGYYEIIFNTQNGDYSVTPYIPADIPVNLGQSIYLDAGRPEEGSIPLEIGLVGSGLPNSGNWSPAEPYILAQDSENPYVLYAEVTLSAGHQVEFIIHNRHSWGWWDYMFWRWDSSIEPEANVSQGGQNPPKWTVPTTGRYMFKFDTHLLRSKFYPIN
ncbi:MAG: hypothetical protein Q4G18_08570 [Myroides sp.]|nr:hypothetical protein [Myroides sp.]